MAVLSITALISAETGEGAAGCASGSQTCNGRMPAFAPNPKSASRNATVVHARRWLDCTHAREGVVAGARLQHAEAEQDRDRTDVRDEQVQVTRAPNFRVAVIARHEEEGRQRHRLPSHHEGVGVVGQQHERHAGEKHVVVERLQPGRRALAPADVAGGEDGNAGAHAAQQQQEECGKRVEPKMERQVGQPERENPGFRRLHEGDTSRNGQNETPRCARAGRDPSPPAVRYAASPPPPGPGSTNRMRP